MTLYRCPDCGEELEQEKDTLPIACPECWEYMVELPREGDRVNGNEKSGDMDIIVGAVDEKILAAMRGEPCPGCAVRDKRIKEMERAICVLLSAPRAFLDGKLSLEALRKEICYVTEKYPRKVDP